VNLGDIRNEAMRNGFDPILFGTARMNQFINDGYQYICSQTNYTGDEATLDFPTAASQGLYPQPADASDIRNLRDADRNLELVSTALRRLDRSNPSATGRPTAYALNGANFQLFPTPDGIYNLECRYWRIPAALVADTDIPIIPIMWHWLLWSWAVAQAFRAEDDVQRAGAWDARFAKGLSDFNASVRFNTDTPTVAASMWNSRPAYGRYAR